MKMGLTTHELLALGFEIDTGGTEASDGKSWRFLCGGCCRWCDGLTAKSNYHGRLCEFCTSGKQSFDKWAEKGIYGRIK